MASCDPLAIKVAAAPGPERFGRRVDLIEDGLRAAADGDVSAADLRGRVAAALRLTEADLAEMLPSGRQTTFANRTAWANIFLQRAGLLEKVSRGVYRITDEGRTVLVEQPSGSTCDSWSAIRPMSSGGSAAQASSQSKEDNVYARRPRIRRPRSRSKPPYGSDCRVAVRPTRTRS